MFSRAFTNRKIWLRGAGMLLVVVALALGIITLRPGTSHAAYTETYLLTINNTDPSKIQSVHLHLLAQGKTYSFCQTFVSGQPIMVSLDPNQTVEIQQYTMPTCGGDLVRIAHVPVGTSSLETSVPQGSEIYHSNKAQ
jgi:hypothetical protein